MVSGMTRSIDRFCEAPLPGFDLGEGKTIRPVAPVRKPDADLMEDHRKFHRQRLRQRFTEGGAQAMPDYELLELLLFRAIRRGDTKPLAKRLMKTFGDLNHILAAPPARLKDVQGVGDAVVFELKMMEAVGHRMARAKIMKKPVLSSWDNLLEYCQTAMAHQDIEQFRVLYLDRKNVLIADEEQQRGTVDHVPVYPREVVKRALEVNASAIGLYETLGFEHLYSYWYRRALRK